MVPDRRAYLKLDGFVGDHGVVERVGEADGVVAEDGVAVLAELARGKLRAGDLAVAPPGRAIGGEDARPKKVFQSRSYHLALL